MTKANPKMNGGRYTPPANESKGQKCGNCGVVDRLYNHNGKWWCHLCIDDFTASVIAETQPQPYTQKMYMMGDRVTYNADTVFRQDTQGNLYPSGTTSSPNIYVPPKAREDIIMDEMKHLVRAISSLVNRVEAQDKAISTLSGGMANVSTRLTSLEQASRNSRDAVKEVTETLKDLLEELAEQ